MTFENMCATLWVVLTGVAVVEVKIDGHPVAVSDRQEKIIRLVLSSEMDEHPNAHLEFDCSGKQVRGKIEVPLQDNLTTA